MNEDIYDAKEEAIRHEMYSDSLEDENADLKALLQGFVNITECYCDELGDEDKPCLTCQAKDFGINVGGQA